MQVIGCRQLIVMGVGVALMISGCTAQHPVAKTRPSSAADVTASVSAANAIPSGSGPEPAVSTAAAPTAAHPCGLSATARYTHVVWIWMENKGYSSVIGSGNAPFENLLAKQCGLATDNNGVSHPSLPNYLAATGGATFGVTDDGSPAAHQLSADSIFGQLGRAGLTWRSYQESMPRNCDTTASGEYAVKHNPAVYYLALRTACGVDDVPLQGFLDRDLAAGTLPSFSFITPNLCDDSHDCSVGAGDEWLAAWIPTILDGSNYGSGNTLVVITWDEAEGSTNRIPMIVVGPTVPEGAIATQRFDHYSLLRTTEDIFGLAHLQNAASAPSIAGAFSL